MPEILWLILYIVIAIILIGFIWHVVRYRMPIQPQFYALVDLVFALLLVAVILILIFGVGGEQNIIKSLSIRR